MPADKKIGDLKFGVVVEGKEFAQGTKELTQKVKELDKGAKDSSKGVDALNKNLEKGAKSAQSFGQSLVKYLSFAFVIGAVVKFTKALFDLGSQLDETQSKFNVVFKGIETKANTAFENLAKSTGRSTLELKEFGAQTASMVKSLGFTNNEALDLSSNITKLGVDLASFNNISDAQAIDALQGALAGRTMGLRNLGIVLSDADVKEEAYRIGLAKTGDELSNQQTALATYNLLLKNTTDAQGETARSADSFANQLKTLRGVIKDTLATTGQQVAKDTAGMVKTLSDFMQTYGKGLIQTSIDTTKTVLSTISSGVSGYTEMYNQLDGRTEESNKKQMSALNIFAVGIQGLLLIIKNFLVGAVTVIEAVGIVLGDLFRGMITTASDTGKLIFNVFKALGIAVAGAFVSLGDKVMGSLTTIANGAIKAVNWVISQVNKIPKVDIPILGTFGEAEKHAGDFETAFGNTLKDIGANVKNFGKDLDVDFNKTFSEVGQKFTDFASGAKEDFLGLGSEIIQNSEKQNDALDSTAGKFDKLSDLLKKYNKNTSSAGKASEDMKKEVQSAIDDISTEYDKWKSGITSTEEKLKSLRDKNAELMSEIGSQIKETVNSIEELNKSYEETSKKEGKDFAESIASQIVQSKENIKTLRAEQDELSRRGELTQEEADRIDKSIKENQATIDSGYQLVNEGLLTQADIDEAVRKSALTDIQLEAEKFKASEEQRKKDFEDQKAILEERQALLKAIQEGEAVDLTTIKDFKNQQMAEELLAQKAQIDEEIKNVQNEQIAIQNAWLLGASAIESINDQLISRLDAKYQALAERIRSALASASGASFAGAVDTSIASQNGFQSGGFTSAGPSNKVAGVVHGGEFVANSRMVRDNKSLFEQLDHIQRKGYQNGGPVTNNNQRTINLSPTVHSRVGLRAVLNEARFHLR